MKAGRLTPFRDVLTTPAILLPFVLLIALVLASGAKAASPPLLTKFCKPGSAAGQCSIPRGIAVNQSTGNFYVANQENIRIDEFTAWGVFVKGWGWDVVATGPGDDTSPPEDQFEICVPADGDVCKAGVGGAAAGQFGAVSRVQGLALDSAGNVFAVDRTHHRVQKFAPSGQFLLMFGGNVNQGPNNPGNVCTAADIAGGDVCGAGTTGPAPNPPGQFGGWPVASFITVGPGDKVYVGDEGRLQRFGVNGVYQDELILPPGRKFVSALTADPSGNLYVGFAKSAIAFETEPDVVKLSAAGTEICTVQATDPQAVATDSAGNLYLVDGVALAKFSPECVEDASFRFLPGLNNSTGLSISSACDLDGIDIIVSNTNQANSYVAIYGPPPDPDVCPQPEAPPSIEDSFTASVSTDGATVRARINPHFWADTTYRVQYGTEECSKGSCVEERPASLLTNQVLDASLTTAGVLIPDLQPGTTYHYRFVAESGGGGPVFGPELSFRTFPTPTPPPSPDPCPNAVFRTGASAQLPDCRAYELVSPHVSNSGDVAVDRATVHQAAVSGEAMIFSSFSASGEPVGAPIVSQFLALRSPGEGWSTRSLATPRTSISLYPSGGETGLQYKAFSDDLCDGWILQDSDVALAPGAPPGVPNLYRRDICGDAAYELLTTAVPPGFGLKPFESEYYPEIMGFSADGARSVFRANAKLTPNASAAKGLRQLYVAYDGGELRLVSVLPSGNASTTDSTAGTSYAPLGINGVFREDSLYRAVSTDGSRVFWSEASPVSGPARLYVRLNATAAQSKIAGGKCTDPAKACTLAISESANARFLTADPQGDTAIYTDSGNLYEFNVESATSQLIAKGVKGVMGASEDASRIYFVSSEALDAGTIAGKSNLYLYERGSGFTFIATLSNVDSNSAATSGASVPVANKPNLRTSRVSPDGLHAAFTSLAPLTGYDNTDAGSGDPDAEVFLYDATADGGEAELVCASCNPTGARPQGSSRIPGWNTQFRPTRALSDGGNRLFFNSVDRLVPRDTNGKMDVYQWEAPGPGDCTEESSAFVESNGGCLSLISSGESVADSEFLDATPSGSDVFFVTQSDLLSEDFGLRDVYGARVNGGFPPPPDPPPACEGEACQGAPAPPNDPTPASSAFEGAGNVVESRPPRRCAKGKVRRRGRCVVRKRGKQARQRASRKVRAGR